MNLGRIVLRITIPPVVAVLATAATIVTGSASEPGAEASRTSPPAAVATSQAVAPAQPAAARP